MLECNGVTDTGTHATLFTVMGSHHFTQDSAGRPTLSLKLMVDAAFRMTVASAWVTAAEMAAAWCAKKFDGEARLVPYTVLQKSATAGEEPRLPG